MWLFVLKYPRPYPERPPGSDGDVMTSYARMWTHNWWANGPLRMWFAMPYSPLSVETPTLADVTLYQSWPPGAIVPIFLLAKILNVEPGVPLINWFNVATHGVIALAVA